MILREMTFDDYETVFKIWNEISGFGIRSIDDSAEGIERFLARNPHTSVVAIEDGIIVGSILCGHDGRRGSLYHVCVKPEYRRRGIGTQMVAFAMNALKEEKINKITLIAFKRNDCGNAFWNRLGWTFRDDINNYDFVINENNITNFVK